MTQSYGWNLQRPQHSWNNRLPSAVEHGGDLVVLQWRQQLLSAGVDADAAGLGDDDVDELAGARVLDIVDEVGYAPRDTEAGAGRVTRLQHAALNLALRHCKTGAQFTKYLTIYRKIIARSTNDSDLKSAKVSFRNIVS